MRSNTRIIHSTAFAVDAANVIVEIGHAAIRERGVFRFGLSGGNTPRGVYRELAAMRHDLDWAQVLITFGDERCVPPDHADSNYKMACESFLHALPIPSQNIHRLRGELDPAAAAEEYENQLARMAMIAGEPRFVHDLLLLGLGNDGHTASLFPGTEALREGDRGVVANHVPQLSADRLTFTYPLINASRHVMFLVEGAGKLPILREIWRGGSPHPAERVHPEHGQLTWLLGF